MTVGGTVQIVLPNPASEMAQEEILKQSAFIAPPLTDVRFMDGGTKITYRTQAGAEQTTSEALTALANKVIRGLRNLQRQVVFRSSRCDQPRFRGQGQPIEGVHPLGKGQVALSGLPLRLFNYFDRTFESFGTAWGATPYRTPTLIPSEVLGRCDYFRSFPHNVTFADHLVEDAKVIDGFRARHQQRNDLDEQSLRDFSVPEACLSPAVCYHIYHLLENQTVPDGGLIYGICGKCFRYESSNISDLRRLWDFTMRESVIVGTRQKVLEWRQMTIEKVSAFLEDVALAGEIRTASDPFFVAPDAVAKTYFQLSSETKYEMSLMLPDDARIAVGSHNYHSDFFGKAFHTQAESLPMHSVCVAFGLERWVYAFLMQHGFQIGSWPAPVRNSPHLTD